MASPGPQLCPFSWKIHFLLPRASEMPVPEPVCKHSSPSPPHLQSHLPPHQNLSYSCHRGWCVQSHPWPPHFSPGSSWFLILLNFPSLKESVLPCSPDHPNLYFWWLDMSYAAANFLVAQWDRICLPVQEIWVQSLDQEDSLEKKTANPLQYSFRKTPLTEEPGGLQSMRSQKRD